MNKTNFVIYTSLFFVGIVGMSILQFLFLGATSWVLLIGSAISIGVYVFYVLSRYEFLTLIIPFPAFLYHLFITLYLLISSRGHFDLLFNNISTGSIIIIIIAVYWMAFVIYDVFNYINYLKHYK